MGTQKSAKTPLPGAKMIRPFCEKILWIQDSWKTCDELVKRCQWFGFIAAAIFVPLSYSVGLLIFDLRVRNQGEWINKQDIWTKEVQFQVQIAIDSVRVFLYNIVTTFLLFFMSKRYLKFLKFLIRVRWVMKFITWGAKSKVSKRWHY